MTEREALPWPDRIAKPRVTVSYELDNAAQLELEDGDVRDAFATLLASLARAGHMVVDSFEIVFLLDDRFSEERIRTLIEASEDRPAGLSYHIVTVPGTSYFEKKGLSAFCSDRDIILFADSDCYYAPDWAARMLAPFADPEVMVTFGRTYARLGDFMEQASALAWFFPVDHPEDPFSRNRRYYVNNFASRRRLLCKMPLPRHPARSLQGGLWRKAVVEAGHKLVAAEATCFHKQYDELSGLLARGYVLGRDSDWYMVTVKRAGFARRLGRALSGILRYNQRFLGRLLRLRRPMGLSIGATIGVATVGIGFQLAQVVGQVAGCFLNGEVEPEYSYYDLTERLGPQ